MWNRKAVWWLTIAGVLLIAAAHLSSTPITKRTTKGAELTWQELDDNFTFLDRGAGAHVITISSDAIAVSGPGIYQVETQGGAGTDTITSITGGTGHEEPIVLRLNSAGRTITLTHTAPGLVLQNGANFTLDSINDSIELRSRTSATWTETRRSSVP